MTVLYSPYDIWKITSKPEWYYENYLTTEWGFSILFMIFHKEPLNPNDSLKITTPPMTFQYSPYGIWKITLKTEWYLDNNHPSEWQFSIHINIFEK